MAIVSGLKGVCLLLSILISNAQNDADTYLGCYNDTTTRNSPDMSETYASDPEMTPDKCRESCRRINSILAELLAGKQCSCTERSTSNNLGRLDDSKCNVTCSGDPSKFCGGGPNSNAYSVYTICPKGKFGMENCTHNCNCKDNEQCKVETGVCPENKCAPGWKLNSRTCSIDVDECEFECTPSRTTDCHKCKSADGEICNNTEGSYHCSCRNGFNNETGTCTAEDDAMPCQMGCIIGIIIGILAVSAIIILVAWLIKRRRNPSSQRENNSSEHQHDEMAVLKKANAA